MVRCSVKGCKSDSERKNAGISFHVFPHQKYIREAWTAACGRADWAPKASSKICSLHFEEGVLIKKGTKTYLYPDVVPKMISEIGKCDQREKCDDPVSSTSYVTPIKEETIEDMDIDDKSKTMNIEVSRNIYSSMEMMSSETTNIVTTQDNSEEDTSNKSPEFTPRTLKRKWKKAQLKSEERLKKLKALREKTRRLTKKVANLEIILAELKSKLPN